ncbi:MAG: type III-B CRISPR-associated protein Cas10/Cmr2 [Nitrospinae bacterium]|nr:type III-B CRISPR-associated protein Cas10/Cmr2 [Nitrospinota bacterium]
MREYHPSEFVLKDMSYVEASTGQKLILFEDLWRGRYYGLPEDARELEALRDEFLRVIGTRLPNRETSDRQRLLTATADIFHHALSESPQKEWPSLPADTRRGANRSTLADHSLLTSAIAAGLIQEALSRGKGPDSIVRASPPLGAEELFQVTRIAALGHDLGKFPPSGHRERGREAVERLLKPVLSRELVEAVADVALRHHDARYYREAGQGPLGFFEEAICHADTASGVDRVTELFEEDWSKKFEEIAQLRGEHGFPRYPTSGEAIFNLLNRMKTWEEQEFDAIPPLSLILADVDRVKRYVFESARLPEVRGASRILDQLNREGMEELLCRKGIPYQGQKHLLAPEAILYAAGGGALILAPAYLAEAIAHALERLYLEETGWATISVASHSLHLFELPYGFEPYRSWFDRLRPLWKGANPAERAALDAYLAPLSDEGQKVQDGTTALFQRLLKTKRFGEITAQLNYQLKRAKEEREEVPTPELTPFARLCSSCQTRPATHLEPQPQELYLCEVCLGKRRAGIKQRKDSGSGKGSFVKGFWKYLQNSREEGCRRYQEAVERLGGENRIEVASDLASLGNCANGQARGYVGVIYADGNDIGGHLERISTPAEYRLFARTLLETVEGCVFQSLAEHLEPMETKDQDQAKELIHPFEIVSIGGDDLFLIVPADRALRIALSICRRFEEEFRMGRELTLSAGVVIAKAHSPIYFLQHLAEQLLKSAKKRAWKLNKGREEHQKGGTVDFLILTAEGSSDLDELRRKTYQMEIATEELHLTERPLTLDELERLLRAAEGLRSRRFPRSQLYAIRQSLARGRPFSRNFLFYQLSRLKEDDQQAFGRILADWWGKEWSDDPDFPFRRKGKEEWTTPFADLVEVMDFIRAEGRTER